MKYIRICLIIVGCIINIYIIISVIRDRKRKNENKKFQVNNNKYVFAILFVFILYIIYGILRNFWDEYY